MSARYHSRVWTTLGAALLAILLRSGQARAETWIDSAEHQLYCTRLASSDERASLRVAFGRGSDPDYWASPSRNQDERLRKYLLMLGAVAYEADSSNDQTLRRQALLHAASEAGKAVVAQPQTMRQLYLCAHAALLGSSVETDDPHALSDIGSNLIRAYRAAAPGASVEDLPLVHAIRDASLGPRSGVVTQLATLAHQRAEQLKGEDPERAARLLAAAAQGFSAQGDAPRALQLARESSALRVAGGKQASPEASWSNFPVLYDSARALHGKDVATRLADAMLHEFGPPPETADSEAQYAINLRLARIAQERLGDGGQPEQEWYVTTMSSARRAAQRDHHSIPFFRAALASLEHDPVGVAAQDYVWRHDKAAATRDYRDSYAPMLDTLLRQSQSMPIGDIRTRIEQQAKLEDWLDTLGRLAVALPAQRAAIVDQAFMGLQLHSHSSVSAATMKGYVRRSEGDPGTRQDILRFLTMQADPTYTVRRALDRIVAAGYRDAAADAVFREAFLGLVTNYQASTAAAFEFRRFIWSKAPDLRGLVLGAPGRLAAAQSLLQDDEALAAILPTERSVLVYGITRTDAVIERSDLPRTELRDLVRRVRASVLPIDATPGIRLKPFDAAAAFELYQRTVGRIERTLAGKQHLFWYSGADMAGLPPSLLLAARPSRPIVGDPAELSQLSWFADRHGVSVLPDPYLFWVFRGSRPAPPQHWTFVGVGAPQLSLAELQGARHARSMELAGGLDGVALANLPRLPEAADELRSLADVLGRDKSALLIGAQASKPKLMALLAEGGEIVTFATHGFVANEIAGVSDPSLLLAAAEPGADPLQSLLTSGEIADLDLNSRLVILSACNTATSDGRPRGASFTGLGQSFTSAGARALLVSHWPVASMAATELSVRTVTSARNGKQELAFALRDSMQKFRAAYPEYSHPFYWAPFVFVGDGRRTLE